MFHTFVTSAECSLLSSKLLLHILSLPLLLLTSWLAHTAELLRENKRMLDKAIRDLDRERMGLQTQEKKLVAEIKKTAKQGQMV